MTREYIKPEKPPGVQDYWGGPAIAKAAFMAMVRELYELRGFDPLITAPLERRDVLGIGAETPYGPAYAAINQANAAEGDLNDPSLAALRFDHTVPLARFVAQHWGEIPHPFKRYAWGDVFREEREGGRARVFTQFDCDTVGVESLEADIEIIGLMCDVLLRAGLHDFTVRINNRKVLNALAELTGLEIPQVRSMLTETQTYRGNPLLSDRQADLLTKFHAIATESPDPLQDARAFFGSNSVALEGLAELEEILAGLAALSVPTGLLKIDLSLVRNLGYYTGSMFEARVPDFPYPIMGGGRYDDLVSRFSPMRLPAVGAGIGVDRVLEVLRARQITDAKSTVVHFGMVRRNDVSRQYLFGLAQRIRDMGANVELIPMGESVEEQIANLRARGVRMVIIVDPEHEHNNTYHLFDFEREERYRDAPPSILLQEWKWDLRTVNLEDDLREHLNYHAFSDLARRHAMLRANS